MVRCALLTLLREQSDYGYNLKRRFEDRLGPSWKLNVGQVYQTLRALERAGMVQSIECMADAERARTPERHFFELTEKGDRVLDEWLAKPLRSPKAMRDELVARLLAFGDQIPRSLVKQVGLQRQVQAGRLAKLLSRRQSLSAIPNGVALIGWLTLESALLHTQAHIAWLDAFLNVIQNRTTTRADDPGGRAAPTALAASGTAVATPSALRADSTRRRA